MTNKTPHIAKNRRESTSPGTRKTGKLFFFLSFFFFFLSSDNLHIFFHCTCIAIWKKISVGVIVYFTVMFDHIPLVSLLFAVLVSLHPDTFLMFFITCYKIYRL